MTLRLREQIEALPTYDIEKGEIYPYLGKFPESGKMGKFVNLSDALALLPVEVVEGATGPSCSDYNAILADGARWQQRAEFAEQQLTDAQQTIARLEQERSALPVAESLTAPEKEEI